MRKRINEWMEMLDDPSYEPAWVEPMEWMSIGFVIAVVLLNLIL